MTNSLRSESTNTRLVGLLFDNFGPYHFARLRGAQAVLGPGTVVGLQIHAQSSDTPGVRPLRKWFPRICKP